MTVVKITITKWIKRKVRVYILGDRWVVRKCRWPYAEGYATYNPHKKTVLDTGLREGDAKDICKELNAIEENRK